VIWMFPKHMSKFSIIFLWYEVDFSTIVFITELSWWNVLSFSINKCREEADSVTDLK
jgi:hypothetical protein